MEVFDFIATDDDLTIEGGDFAFGESTRQHQRDLLIAEKGSFRQSPEVGVALRQELMNEGTPEDLRRIIQQQFENDGMRISQLTINGPDINLTAAYVSA